MTLNDYQVFVKQAVPEGRSHDLSFQGLGIAGEAGEVANEIKKSYYSDHPLDKLKVREELGDTLFHIAQIATMLGLDLNDIAYNNLSKVESRFRGQVANARRTSTGFDLRCP